MNPAPDPAADAAAVVSRYLDAVNDADLGAAEAQLADDVVLFPAPTRSWAPDGAIYRGHQGWRTVTGELGLPRRGFSQEVRLEPVGDRVLGTGTVNRETEDGTWVSKEIGLVFSVGGGLIRSIHAFNSPQEARGAGDELIMWEGRVRDEDYHQAHAPPGVQGRGSLTPRQREIFQLLAEGLNGPEVAEKLVISPGTVRTHVTNAMAVLGAKTRAHAIAEALRRGEIAV